MSWTYRYYSDSETIEHPGFDSGLSFPTYDAALDSARTALGQQDWGQSGGNEYAYRDRHGRTGYVYVEERP